jgi:hypothetical protein
MKKKTEGTKIITNENMKKSSTIKPACKGNAKNQIIFHCRHVSYHTETLRLDLGNVLKFSVTETFHLCPSSV